MASPFDSVEEYLSAVPVPEFREALLELRKIILDEVPGATECISYGIPTYKLNKMLVSMAAFKNHCSLFPGHTVEAFREELRGFKISKGTVQFHPSKPIPECLVRRILQQRLLDIRHV